MPIDYMFWLLLPLKATLIVLNYTYLRFQVRNLNVNSGVTWFVVKLDSRSVYCGIIRGISFIEYSFGKKS